MRSMRQIIADIFCWENYLAHPAEVGLGSSNAPVEVLDGEWQQFLNVKLSDYAPAGCDGMATVHLYAAEILPTPPATIPDDANSKLVVDGHWQSGLGGGDFQVDGAHGMFLCLGANSAINLKARLESAVEGAPLVIGSKYRVEAVTKWYTSPGGGPAVLSLPSRAAVAAEGAFLTDFFKIPRQARTLSGYASTFAAYGTLVAEFASAPSAAAIRYVTLAAPRREMIVAGAEWVRFRTGVAAQVTPAFELWV